MSYQLKEIGENKQIAIALVFVLVITSSLIGFMIGCIEGNRKDGCVYSSVMSYFPAHYIDCELFKPRFREVNRK